MSGCTQRRTQSLCQGAHNAGHSRYVRVHTMDTVVMSVYTQRTLSRYVRVHTTQSLCQGAHNTVVMSGCTQHSRYVSVHTTNTKSLCQGAHNGHSRYVSVHATDTVVMSGAHNGHSRYVRVHTTDTVVMSGCTQRTQSLCQGAHNGHSRYVRVHTTDTVVTSGCTQRTQSLCQGAHNGHPHTPESSPFRCSCRAYCSEASWSGQGSRNVTTGLSSCPVCRHPNCYRLCCVVVGLFFAPASPPPPPRHAPSSAMTPSFWIGIFVSGTAVSVELTSSFFFKRFVSFFPRFYSSSFLV